MNRSTPFLLTALLATSLFTPRVFGQVRNTNQSRRLGSVIVGGQGNLISSNCQTSFIGGGNENKVGTNAWRATIAGGLRNTASDWYSTVAGGFDNTASGGCAMVAGGSQNEAHGMNSFAAGYRAKAIHDGSFVWSDGQLPGGFVSDFESFTTNTFNVRASSGVRFDNNTSMFFGNETRQMLNLYNQNYAVGVQSNAMYFRTGNSFYWYLNGSHTNTMGGAGAGGSFRMTLDENGNLGVAGNVVCNSVIETSDRNAKQDIRPLDPKEILQKVAALPISQWSYKASPAERHYGPMAQDFRAAFGVGKDEKTIAMVDADGVALASIKGLVEELKDRDKAIDELKSELRALREQISKLPPAP